VNDNTVKCEACGAVYGIGCSPFCRDGHQPVRGSAQYVQFNQLFSNYYDEGLDVVVTGRDHRRRVMRDMKVDHREPPSRGDLSARRDKMMERRRERELHG